MVKYKSLLYQSNRFHQVIKKKEKDNKAKKVVWRLAGCEEAIYKKMKIRQGLEAN